MITIQKKISDFTLHTPEGEGVDFSSLSGKYVVIHFWASWCKPCLETFPVFMDLFIKYEKENFAIYSISVDLNKNAWLRTIDEFKPPWLQAIDTIDINESIFKITGIPATFLICPEGTIIMENFSIEPGGKFDSKIASVFT